MIEGTNPYILPETLQAIAMFEAERNGGPPDRQELVLDLEEISTAHMPGFRDVLLIPKVIVVSIGEFVLRPLIDKLKP